MSKVKLSSIVDIISGGTPKTDVNEYWDNGTIGWLSVTDFNNDLRYVYETEKKITLEGLKNSNTKLLNKDDIIISARGTVGALAQIGKPLCFNQSCFGLRGKKGIIENTFLFYCLKNYVGHIKKRSQGSVFDTINLSSFDLMEIEIPDSLSTQQKIASVLSSLDNKIELNNRINSELEAMAKTLYDYWFVQFDFPNEEGKPYKTSGGAMVWNEELKREVPEGWEVGTLAEWINNDKSGDWGKETPEGNYTQKVYCIRGADINGMNGSGSLNTPLRYILEKNLHKNLEPADLIVEISGGSPTQSTGRLAFVIDKTLERFDAPIICSNFCKAVTLKDKKLLFNFVYHWNSIYDAGILFGYEGKTSGIKNLLFESFVSTHLTVLPKKEVVDKFYDIISPIHSKKQTNLIENQKLSELRDWLLPMLMNGQVKVIENEKVAETTVAKPLSINKTTTTNTQIDNFKKIQILYATIWANKELNVKQGEMATAKDVYLLDRIYGVKTGFQFKQQNWGAFDPKEKQLLNTTQYFHKPNFPNSQAFYVDLKDDGKLLEKIPTELQEQIRTGIQEMNDKVFKNYSGTPRAEKKELFATVLKCIEDRQSLELDIIRDAMAKWKVKQAGKETTKATKFSEDETNEALEVIVLEGWYKQVLLANA